MKRKTFLSLIVVAAILAACSSDCILHTFQPVANMEWDRCDTLTFDLPEVPNDGGYQLQLDLRVGNRFPYQQLAVAVETRFQDTIPVHRDTIVFQLADKQGYLQENGTTLYQFQSKAIPLQLLKGQKGQLRIFHVMQRETIPAVSDVGIKITH